MGECSGRITIAVSDYSAAHTACTIAACPIDNNGHGVVMLLFIMPGVDFPDGFSTFSLQECIFHLCYVVSNGTQF